MWLPGTWPWQTVWCIAQITDWTIYSPLLLNNGPSWPLVLTPPGFPCGVSPVAQRWRIHLQCRIHQEMWVWSLGQEDPLKEGMETHSSILAWGSPWTEEPGSLQSTGSQRVKYAWSILAHTHTRVPLYTRADCELGGAEGSIPQTTVGMASTSEAGKGSSSHLMDLLPQTRALCVSRTGNKICNSAEHLHERCQGYRCCPGHKPLFITIS